MQRPGFLTVFVDPGDQEVFDAMARAIGPLNDRHGVLTIVLSQGRAKDGELLMRTRRRAGRSPMWRATWLDPTRAHSSRTARRPRT